MNYANMIEEKNLKKTFIVATLCSTLIGTFTSSMGLWDRVSDRRKQKKVDTSQNDEIKQLRERVEKAEKASKESKRGSDELGDNFERSGALIQRQFDEGYGRLGQRFAIGDTITENQLQAQVISLQQTVITILQDALYNERPLTRADMSKIAAATNSAREGSLSALRDAQQRLGGGSGKFALEGPPSRGPSPPHSRAGSIAGSLALGPPKRASTVIDTDPLYCRYSLELQYIPNKPLAADFAPGGGCRCPACGLRLAVTGDDFWSIGKRTPVTIFENGYERNIMETREFHLGQRFVIKCHTADGEYACVLCNKHRDADAICRTVESLVNHVGKFHSIEELEKDVDLPEKPVSRPLMLDAPPPVPMPPATKEIKEVREVVYR